MSSVAIELSAEVQYVLSNIGVSGFENSIRILSETTLLEIASDRESYFRDFMNKSTEPLISVETIDYYTNISFLHDEKLINSLLNIYHEFIKRVLVDKDGCYIDVIEVTTVASRVFINVSFQDVYSERYRLMKQACSIGL